MKNARLSAVVCFFVVMIFPISGCSEPRPEGMPPLHRVTLEFHQEGAPLVEASVRLISSESSSNQWTVGGNTDAKGRAQLITYGKYDGVPAGKYKICVTKHVSEGELPQIGKATAPMKHFNFVETQYGTEAKTPLEIEIVKGKNKFEPFDLGKAVRIELKAPGQ